MIRTRAAAAQPQRIQASYVAFAAFGVFWGTWGASIPGIKAQAHVSDGQLGAALLCIGVGSVPAMFLTGRLIDRLGVRSTTAALALQGTAGLFMALASHGLTSLCVSLLFVGAASGAADVAINSTAGSAEKETAKPVITRSHGTFSALVVASSLLTGLAGGLDLGPVFAFSLVLLFLAAASGYLACSLPPPDARVRRRGGSRPAGPADRNGFQHPAVPVLSIVLMGVLGALAYANENAHQSWSAVFFARELGTGASFSAIAPAAFAAVAALTRFSTGGLRPRHTSRVLVLGASAAVAGAAILAGAQNVPVALLGLVVAAAGTAVLYPALLGLVSRSADKRELGKATSLLAAVSYLGFLLGPVYVGFWAELAGMRGAMTAVAALAAGLLALIPIVLMKHRGPPLPASPPCGQATR